AHFFEDTPQVAHLSDNVCHSDNSEGAFRTPLDACSMCYFFDTPICLSEISVITFDPISEDNQYNTPGKISVVCFCRERAIPYHFQLQTPLEGVYLAHILKFPCTTKYVEKVLLLFERQSSSSRSVSGDHWISSNVMHVGLWERMKRGDMEKMKMKEKRIFEEMFDHLFPKTREYFDSSTRISEDLETHAKAMEDIRHDTEMHRKTMKKINKTLQTTLARYHHDERILEIIKESEAKLSQKVSMELELKRLIQGSKSESESESESRPLDSEPGEKDKIVDVESKTREQKTCLILDHLGVQPHSTASSPRICVHQPLEIYREGCSICDQIKQYQDQLSKGTPLSAFSSLITDIAHSFHDGDMLTWRTLISKMLVTCHSLPALKQHTLEDFDKSIQASMEVLYKQMLESLSLCDRAASLFKLYERCCALLESLCGHSHGRGCDDDECVDDGSVKSYKYDHSMFFLKKDILSEVFLEKHGKVLDIEGISNDEAKKEEFSKCFDAVNAWNEMSCAVLLDDEDGAERIKRDEYEEDLRAHEEDQREHEEKEEEEEDRYEIEERDEGKEEKEEEVEGRMKDKDDTEEEEEEAEEEEHG
ncbi:hypothetical protein ADUPG1_000519, partial [Aduncisulcus paluster]